MEKIDVKTLLERHKMSWYQLHKRSRGTISKSMANDWRRGKHQPNRRSAVLIAHALGLPESHIVAALQTRERHENRPRREAFCVTCRRKLWKVPASNSRYDEQAQAL